MSEVSEVPVRGEGVEQVVLLSESGEPVGTSPKSTVHTMQTPLHLAFSCYLFDASGRLLLTRRALHKIAWPGVWTNSFCGHPAPGEAMADAVRRRAAQELGAEISQLREVLPDFRYRAVDAGGIVENEVCPVFVATVRPRDGGPAPGAVVSASGSGSELLDPSPDEVCDWSWVDPHAAAEAVAALPQTYSPWLVLQLADVLSALEAAPVTGASGRPAAGHPGYPNHFAERPAEG